MKKVFYVIVGILFIIGIYAIIVTCCGDIFGKKDDGMNMLSSTLPGDGDVLGNGNGLRDGEVDDAPVVNTGGSLMFDTTTYPYRNLLSTEQKKLYNQAYANIMESNDRFGLSATITKDEVLQVMTALYCDHPELFWVETSFSFNYYMSDNLVSSITLYYYDMGDLGIARQKFNTAVSNVVNKASSKNSIVEKEIAIHDAICDMAVYDDHSKFNQSAYSALVNGKTVCAGYTRAFQYCLIKAGIPSYYITGTADGGAHSWNLVLINGSYYNVDISWDDTVGEAAKSHQYPYFNLTDTDIGKDHQRNSLAVNLPKGTSSSLTFNALYGDGASLTADQVRQMKTNSGSTANTAPTVATTAFTTPVTHETYVQPTKAPETQSTVAPTEAPVIETEPSYEDEPFEPDVDVDDGSYDDDGNFVGGEEGAVA